MAGRTAVLKVQIVGDAKGAQEAFSSTSRASEDLGKKVMAGSAVAVAAIGAFAVKAANAAAEQRSAFGALGDVYGASAKQVEAFSKSGADALGLSATETANAAVQMGAALRGMGLSAQASAQQVTSVMPGLRDLASLYNVDMATAVDAYQSALRGEFDALQRIVPSVNAATIEQKALAETHKKSAKDLTASDKAAALYAITMGDAAKATGTWQRENKGGAAAQEKANAKFKDATAALGQALLPAMDAAVRLFTRLAEWVGRNVGLVQGFAVAIGAVAIVLGTIAASVAAYNAVLGVMAVLQGRAAAQTTLQTAALVAQRTALFAVRAAAMLAVVAQLALNVAWAVSPIGVVVIGLLALGAVFVLLWKKCDTFRKICTAAFNAIKVAATAVWSWIRGNWPLLLAVITGPIGIAVTLVIRNWDRIKAAASAAVSGIRSAWSALVGFFSGIAGGIGRAMSGVFDAITGPFRRAMDWVKSHFHLPAIHLPGLPGKAAPTGFAAPSAGLRAAPQVRPGTTARGRTAPAINVTVRVDPLVSPTAAGAVVVNALRAYTRANGPIPVAVR